MTYKQGVISGLIITAIVALLSPLTQWIISTVITLEYFANVITYSVESGYYATVAEAKENFNLKTYIIQSVVGALFFGTVTSFVVAIFVKTKSRKMVANK